MMLLDTSAWIEIAQGTEKGRKILEITSTSLALYTNIITIAEVSQWAEKNKLDINEELRKITNNSTIIQMEFEMLKVAGKDYCMLRKIKKKISLIDSIIYTSASIHNLELVTADRDFEGLENVRFVK
ncbi:PIN domain-containing protein [Candidatus Micrarchaeota archaeon]|nr:PIN domain-containing protein [Candidatus Micrarchaeota archaeon]